MSVDPAAANVAWAAHQAGKRASQIRGFEAYHAGVPCRADAGEWETGWRVASTGGPDPGTWAPPGRALCPGVFEPPAHIEPDDSIAGELVWACSACFWRIAVHSEDKTYLQPPPYVPVHDRRLGPRPDMRECSPLGGRSIESFLDAHHGG